MSDREDRLSGRELALIFLFWTFLATLSAVNRLIDPRGFGFRGISSPAGPIALAFIESWTWALMTPLVFWLTQRKRLAPSLWIRILLLILLGFAIAIGVYVIVDFARTLLIPTRRGFLAFSPIRDILRLRFVNQLLVYFAVLAAGFARELYLRDRVRQAQAVRLQAQLAEARLDALRMQINPHFLFNTLHAISALVERDPSGVRKMIARMSELLRYTIESHASDEVPLRDELEFLGRYIDIMKIRFQGRLNVEQRIDPAALDARVPNLILQPIVENALEHGVGQTGNARVEIAAQREGNRLLLRVRDNGPGLAEDSRSGVGLANTRARLAQLYANDAELTVANAEEGGVIATIALPWHV